MDEIIPVDRALFRKGNPARVLAGTFSLLRRLRRGRFSLAIDFQGYGETALLTWLTRAPERWGVVYHKARGLAYTRGLKLDRRLHPAEANRSMLENCGLKIGAARNEFVLPPAAEEAARRFFAEQQLKTAKATLFIQPFTSSTHKDWPLAKFLELAGHWKKTGGQTIFGGGPADRIALEPARTAGFPVSAGAPLLTTGGLMKLSSLVVGADTGLLHLAVAMNKRVVMLMNYGGWHKTFPFQHADWIIAPSTRSPIASIETARVIEGCEHARAEANP